MFVEVAGKYLRTGFADAPRVTIEGRDGLTECSLRFDSSALDSDGMNWVTILRFTHVLDFRFSEFELGLEIPNRHDFAYALIMLTDSEILRQFTESRALKRTAVPVLNDSELQHYRIAFDDHGVYDIVCTSVNVFHEYVAA